MHRRLGEMSYSKKNLKIQRKTGCNFIASTTDSTKLEMGIGPVRRKSSCILPVITKTIQYLGRDSLRRSVFKESPMRLIYKHMHNVGGEGNLLVNSKGLWKRGLILQATSILGMTLGFISEPKGG